MEKKDYQFDRLQEYLIKRTSNDEVRTENCRIPNQLDQAMLDTEKKIEDTRLWLEYLGDPWMSSLGGTTINYLMPIWNTFIFYFVILVSCKSYRWSINQVGFMMYPHDVRFAVQRQLNYLVAELIKTVTFYRMDSISLDSSSNKDDIERKTEDSRSANARSKATSGRIQVILHRLDLIQQFLKTNYWSLVNPIVYSAHWLKTLTLATYLILSMVGLAAMGFWIIGVIYWQLNEYQEQARTRLSWTECQNWNPLAKPINSYRRPEELTLAEIEAYKECDGSLLSLIIFGISVESKYFLSYRKILTLAEIVLVWPAVVSFAILCLTEFILGIFDKVRWLEQIRSQVSICYEKCLIEHIDENKEEQKQLLELTLAAYLNYSLFLSHFEPFKRTANMFMNQIFSQTIPVIISVYYLSSNHGRAANFAWHCLLIFYIAILCNLFLVCYSLVVKKARQVSKLILKLTAVGSQIHFQSEFIQIPLDLWRRQILEDNQIVDIFGLNFFGIGITLSKIASFNIYLLGLTFIVVRQSGITVDTVSKFVESMKSSDTPVNKPSLT